MKKTVLILGLLFLLSGCSLFTRQSETLTVERQKFINAYARARITYLRVAARTDALCRAGSIGPGECAKMAEIHQQALALDAEIRAKLDTPESEVDWDRVMRLLELGLSLVL